MASRSGGVELQGSSRRVRLAPKTQPGHNLILPHEKTSSSVTHIPINRLHSAYAQKTELGKVVVCKPAACIMHRTKYREKMKTNYQKVKKITPARPKQGENRKFQKNSNCS